MFKRGQQVRVKSLQEIAKTLDRPIEDCNNVSYNRHVHFCMEMDTFCGHEFYVDYIDGNTGHITISRAELKDDKFEFINEWVWDELWLEPLKPVVHLPEDLFTL